MTDKQTATTLWHKLKHIWADQGGNSTEGFPFFMVITVLLIATPMLLGRALADRFGMLQWVLFAVLMAAHIMLHWMSPRFLASSRDQTTYFLIQGVLSIGIVWVSESPEITLLVFAALIGETIGVFGQSRQTWVTIAAYLALVVSGIYSIGGRSLLEDWLPPATSTVALLIIFMVLYQQQSAARAQSQQLLTELKIAHDQLADYASEVEALTLNEERQRIARELHDTLAQGVVGLILQLEAAKHHLEHDQQERVGTIIEQAMDRARETLSNTRTAIDDLRVNTAPQPLHMTVQQRVDRFILTTGIPCDSRIDIPTKYAIPAHVTTPANHIIGEALTNIARHAHAQGVCISLKLDESENLLITIKDDGIGFDLSKPSAEGHYGLQGINERVQLVNGGMTITSNSHQGTTLDIILPLKETA